VDLVRLGPMCYVCVMMCATGYVIFAYNKSLSSSIHGNTHKQSVTETPRHTRAHARAHADMHACANNIGGVFNWRLVVFT